MPWDGEKTTQHRLIRIARTTEEGPEEGSVPSSESQVRESPVHGHQHMVLLAERHHFGRAYTDLCDDIEVCTFFLDERRLKMAPHWTTLHKSSERVNTGTSERFLVAFLEEARLRVLHPAVDSTGSARHL